MAGLSTDLVIEQELMRSLKTTGGLTRGSRMTENQRNIWVMSRPSCAQVNNTIQNKRVHVTRERDAFQQYGECTH